MNKMAWSGKVFFTLSKKVLIPIVLMIVLSSVSMFTLLTLVSDYRQNFSRVHEAANGADNVFVFASADADGLKTTLEQELDRDEKVAEYDLLEVSGFWGEIPYGKGTIASYILSADLDAALAKDIGQYTIVSRDETITDGVIIPYLFLASGNYKIGDKFTVTDNTREVIVRVAGFYSSTLTDTPSCYMMALLFSGESYRLVTETFDSKAVSVSVRLHDRSDSAAFESGFPEVITDHDPNVRLLTQNRFETIKGTKYLMVTIITGVIGVICTALILITFISLNILLNNFIHDHTQLFGIMKTMGYGNKLLNYPVLFLFMTCAALASVCGIGLTYLIFPLLNRMLEAQCGIPYNVRFLPTQSLIVVVLILADTLIAVIISEKAITNILPIQAIRELKETKSVGKERYTIEKSRLPVNLSLAVKSITVNPRQSIIVILTMLAASFTLVFSLMLANTIFFFFDDLAGTTFGETADISVTLPCVSEQALIDQLESDDRISNYVSYDSQTIGVDHFDQQITARIVNHPEKLRCQQIFYEGNYPTSDSEVCLGGKFAEEHGISIGDTVTLRLNGNMAEYTVCGFSQTFTYLGNECVITQDGYEKIGKIDITLYYISVKNSDTRQEVIHDLRAALPGAGVSDLAAYRVGTVEPYLNILTTVTAFLAAICLIVVFLVVYYLTSYILTVKHKSVAIMKAIGFTTKACIIQIASEILLPVLISVSIGTAVSYLVINPMMKLFLSGIGMMTALFSAPLWSVILAAGGLVVLVLLFVILVCLKIRNYSFRALLNK